LIWQELHRSPVRAANRGREEAEKGKRRVAERIRSGKKRCIIE
jgi:hypothetical protein